ncbi:hypothetical protein [Psychroserpens sp. MEBiC05023]
MSKKLPAIFFSLVFLTLTIVPTIIHIVDSSIDVSLLCDISEEEEEKESEKNKEFEVFVIEFDNEAEDIDTVYKQLASCYSFKTYPKPHLNLISPPPEFIL